MDEFTAIEKTVRQQQTRYYGKYRAFVSDNADPEKLGRCRLVVPSVLGETTTNWALPCTPYGGAANIGFLAVPPVGAQVIAEFMEGDVSSPLWTGTFWRKADELPEEFAANSEPSAKVLRTESGHVLLLEDKSGDEKITLKSSAEAVVEMISDGSVSITDSGGATVTLDANTSEIRIEDANGNSCVLSASGMTFKDPSGNEITTEAGGITVKAPATVTIQGASVAVGGSGGEPLIKGTSFLAAFNAHTHLCSAPGSPSGPPVPPLTPSSLTTKSTAL
ncbi:phage baseplate assembly protein V [Ancylobacter sp. Lp-2]|uniref:phage baseplate assembly protein V n=1 Tax=Ancylobacter sp. Lp-2 TaxID=2881339 RepID=UPI001E5D5CCF|nr:phage baseplate assembly protein V [Ancylobacter sp. Lp-2]MCB4768052.1 phage baseplate assembly protein V [Ancylobacter sp. Lp-2]